MSNEPNAASGALPSPPRNVRRRPGASGLAGWTGLVLLPFAAVGIVMLLVIPLHLAFLPKPAVVILFNILIWAFFWFVRLPLMQEKKLVETGIATPGLILDTASYRGKTTMYTATFTFKIADETEMQKKAVISAYAFGKLTDGHVGPVGPGAQQVTVLYNPASPQNALIYECCEYQVI